MSRKNNYENELYNESEIRKTTTEFINIIHDLWYDKSIELVLFRNSLIDKRASEVLNLVSYSKKFVNKPISITDILEISQHISNLDLPPSKLDIGKLVYECHLEENTDKKTFIHNQFSDIQNTKTQTPKDVILYGFGRIGRLLTRELMVQIGAGSQLRLRAIVTRGEINQSVLEKRASLLRIDSVHGNFLGTVEINTEKKALIINGTTVYMISASKPEDIDYTKYQINDALVIDNTGAFRDFDELNRHLTSNGASKVLLTAPDRKSVV